MDSDELRELGGIEHQLVKGVVPPIWRLVSRHGRAIVPFNEVGEGPAFYCVHPISGDVTSFSDLARALGSGERFYGIQVPRRNMNAAFAVSISAVARHHIEALLAHQPEGPFILGGWSAGAIIALEMAQQLRALGHEVPLLIALDGAPCNTGAGISRWNPVYTWRLICNLPGWFKYEVKETGSLRAFTRQAFDKIVFRARMTLPPVRSEQTLNGGAVQDLIDHTGWKGDHIAFIRALYDAMRAYVPESYAGRVVVYESKTQPLDHLLQVGAAWMKIAKNAEIVPLDGNHGSTFQRDSVGILAEHLRNRIADLGRSNRESTPNSEPAGEATAAGTVLSVSLDR